MDAISYLQDMEATKQTAVHKELGRLEEQEYLVREVVHGKKGEVFINRGKHFDHGTKAARDYSVKKETPTKGRGEEAADQRLRLWDFRKKREANEGRFRRRTKRDHYPDGAPRGLGDRHHRLQVLLATERN